MTNSLSPALAHAIVDDRLRSARERRDHRAGAGLIRLRAAVATAGRWLPNGARKPVPCADAV